MLSDKHARHSVMQIFKSRSDSKRITSKLINNIINLNNALKNDAYTINDISLLVKEAFKNRWNTTKDIKNYRDIDIQTLRITCYATANWGLDTNEVFIEIFPDNNRLIVNVVIEDTGEIRQGSIKF